MNVAYDLRFACDHFTGIGTHAWALLEALLDQPGDDRFTVLWNPALPARRFEVAALARHPRVRWIEQPWHPLRAGDLIRLSMWLRRLRPDVFLSPFYLHPAGAGCPVVLTLHDVFPLVLPEGLSRGGRLLFHVALSAARRADLVLTGSEFSRAELVRLGGLAPERVAPLGVRRLVVGDPARPRGVPDEPFALVIGENRPRKNLALLAHAWALPGERLALVSVGRNDARYPSLEALVAGRDTQGRVVRSLGWASERELAWLYRHASMVLFPSRYEGFGFPIVEAFAAGAPVLASDIPAFREVGRSCARYAAPDDPRAWTAAIASLRGDHAAQSALVGAGRSRAAELSYDRTAAATIAALREAATGLLQRAPGAAIAEAPRV